MLKHSIAETYAETFEFLKERTSYYSGKQWSTESEHDPGLTSMQLLANALALLEEKYTALLDKPSIFSNTSYSAWHPTPEDQKIFHFKPHFTAPTKQDFKTIPAVSEDIRNMAEKSPGIKRAWTSKANPEHPVLLVEFAEVMPALNNDGNNEEEVSAKQKTKILHALAVRLQEFQGFCQPVLPVREAVPFPLCMHIALQCELHEINGNALQKKGVPAQIAAAMNAVGEFLYSGIQAKTSFQLVDLQSYLENVSSVQCTSFIGDTHTALENEKFFHGYEQITLSEEHDFFHITQWSFSLEHLAHRRDASPDEIHIAKHLQSLSDLHTVWTEQWFEPEKQIAESKETQEDSPIPLSDTLKADQILVHKQFPACYNLDKENGNVSAENLQMQGWLLLFEQLLADMEKPLSLASENCIDRYFQFSPLELANLVGLVPHASLDKLSAVGKYEEKLMSMTSKETHFSQLPKTMLKYLAALQGEETWACYEDTEKYTREEKESQAKRILDEENIAFWLRGLAMSNGRRLSNNRRIGVRQFELGGNILEDRLSVLLRALRSCRPKLSQRNFTICLSPNPVTGEDEFRCYIFDSAKKLRIICDVMAPSPEEAERIAFMVLHFAKIPKHYFLDGEKIRIGWLAKLPAVDSLAKDSVDVSSQIKECVEWVKTLLAPWVKVISYEDLGEPLPYCLAVLVAEEDVPQKHRETLEIGIRKQIPAHLFPRVFFLNQKDKKRVDLLSQEADGLGFSTEHARFSELRNILRQYEETQKLLAMQG